MILTQEQQALLNGEKGETMAKVVKTLVMYGDAFGAESTVAVHIRHLREKIEINPSEPKYLKVVWAHGYKLEKGDK